jgi:hypothetical protein
MHHNENRKIGNENNGEEFGVMDTERHYIACE